ncbi:MAG: hypothetical protein ACFFCS_02210 [Candidatus Hodarchaeota archaeon]
MEDYVMASPAHLFLWGMAVATLCFCGIYYIIMSKKQEIFSEKLLLFGFASLLFGIASMRIFFICSDLSLDGNYMGHSFLGDFDSINDSYRIFVKTAYTGGIVGFTFLILAWEKVIKRTKYIISLLNTSFVALVIILPFDTAKTVAYVVMLFDVTLFFIVLFTFTRKSRIEFQAVSTPLATGFFIMTVGHVLDSSVFKQMGIVPIILPSVLHIIGSIVIIIPTFISPKYFSRFMIYWLSFVLCVVVLLSISIVYLIQGGITSVFSQIIIVGIISLFVITGFATYGMIRNIRAKQQNPSGVTDQEILKIFTRRPGITEEEVTYYREQKICLVCKGKVSRIMYLCPECDALYCFKCSTTLSNLENACWSCNTPFDPEKGQNLEIYEEELSLQDKDSLIARKK